MAIQAFQLLPLVCLALIGTSLWHFTSDSFTRRSFPSDFVFGTTTSAYQVEGAAHKGGKGPSIWDTFTHKYPERMMNQSNGDVAIDSYHRYKEDVSIMKELGVDAYRFSISWSRILPNGKISGGINKEGIQYYNNLIAELKFYGLEPYVTIFHYDVPQALEDQYGGFLSPKIIDDFQNYANLCFKLFGDRVKHWITVNEPWSFSRMGYSLGKFAPGRCSSWVDAQCSVADSGREPYIVAHHQLLAHAATVKLYRDKYQASQKGKIGITLICHWYLPYSNKKSDMDAATRAIDFMFGWFMDPLTQGDYPFIMKAVVQDRLPQFTAEQSQLVKGSFDFLGLNYYTTNYAESVHLPTNVNISYDNDMHLFRTGVRQGIPIGPMGALKSSHAEDALQAGSNWLFVYPPGLRELLLYIKDKYNNPIIYITENGVDETNNATLALENSLNDGLRIDYHRQHLASLQMAIREGANVKGYFAWSLFDNFEWADGYTVRFGLYYVDYKSLERYPKSSALWYRRFLKT